MATGTYDVVVIGGGPAGSAFATLLAASGWSVGLVERTRFLRYRIGESLVPQVLDILDETGALRKVEAHGFLRKEGGVSSGDGRRSRGRSISLRRGSGTGTCTRIRFYGRSLTILCFGTRRARASMCSRM